MAWVWLLIIVIFTFGFVVIRGAPYVPSKRRPLAVALDTLYELTPSDLLVDIGSGDGVVLRAAARRGARAVGYELNPLLVLISTLLSWRQANVKTRLADFWLVKLPKDTTIIYTFGESRDIKRMAAKVQAEATRLGRPLYFMSYAFQVPGQAPLRHSNLHFLYKYVPLLAK